MHVFVRLSFLFSLFCFVSDGKSCFGFEKLILTSKRRAEHPFTGRNTQQMSFFQYIFFSVCLLCFDSTLFLSLSLLYLCFCICLHDMKCVCFYVLLNWNRSSFIYYLIFLHVFFISVAISFGGVDSPTNPPTMCTYSYGLWTVYVTKVWD